VSPAVAGLPELRAAVDAFPAGAAGLDLAWSPDARAAAGRSLRRHGLCMLGEGLELAVHDLAVLEAADVAWFVAASPPGTSPCCAASRRAPHAAAHPRALPAGGRVPGA
jgi:hypothetical protein